MQCDTLLAILFGIFGGVAGVAVACQARFRSEYVEHVVVDQFPVAVFYLRRPHPVDGHVVGVGQVCVAVPSALRLLYVVDHVAAVRQVPAAVLSALRPRSVVGHVVAAVHAPVLNIFPLRFLLLLSSSSMYGCIKLSYGLHTQSDVKPRVLMKVTEIM